MSSRKHLIARAIERASSAVKSAIATIASAIQQDVRAVDLAARVLEADLPSRTAERKLIRDAAPAMGLSKAAAERMALDLIQPLRELRTVVRHATLFPGKPPAGRVLPVGTPEQRRAARRTNAVEEILETNLRTSSHMHQTQVLVTDDPSQITFKADTAKVWNVYRGAYSSYPAISSFFEATVHRQWWSRVGTRDLAVVDGLPTLDAVPMISPVADIELFAAIWVERGRGYSAKPMHGFIARSQGTTYHARTARAAISGLQRKFAEQGLPAPMTSEEAERRERRLKKIEKRWGSTTVTLQDSLSIGNCLSGTRAWAHAVDLDPDLGRATLSDVISGYRQRPQAEALAVIFAVVRRLGGRP